MSNYLLGLSSFSHLRKNGTLIGPSIHAYLFLNFGVFLCFYRQLRQNKLKMFALRSCISFASIQIYTLQIFILKKRGSNQSRLRPYPGFTCLILCQQVSRCLLSDKSKIIFFDITPISFSHFLLQFFFSYTNTYFSFFNVSV